MAIPTWQAVGSAAAGTGDITVALPAHMADDVLLVFHETNQSTAPAAPTNWDVAAQYAQGSNVTTVTVYWRRATSSGTTNPTFIDPGNHQIGVAAVIRGCITTGNPWDYTPSGEGQSGTTTFATTGQTTTVDDCLVFGVISDNTDTASDQMSGEANANLSSFTKRGAFYTTQGNGGGVIVYTGGLATAGSTGSFSGNIATTSAWAGVTFALKPAAGGTTYSASGTVAATSGTSLSASIIRATAATVAATSATSAAASRLTPASGTVAATSGTSLAATSTRAAAGTVAATSGAALTATSLRLASGQVDALTATSLTAARILPASGQVDATSGTSLDATITSGSTTYPASGTVAVVSGTNLTATSIRLAAGTVPAVSATSLTVTALLPAAGTCAAETGASGSVSGILSASGVIAATSTAALAVTSLLTAAGTCPAVTAASLAATIVPVDVTDPLGPVAGGPDTPHWAGSAAGAGWGGSANGDRWSGGPGFQDIGGGA